MNIKLFLFSVFFLSFPVNIASLFLHFIFAIAIYVVKMYLILKSVIMLQTIIFFYVTHSPLRLLSPKSSQPFPHRKFLLAATLKKIKKPEILELLRLPELYQLYQ